MSPCARLGRHNQGLDFEEVFVATQDERRRLAGQFALICGVALAIVFLLGLLIRHGT
jgi:hypothetical protein